VSQILQSLYFKSVLHLRNAKFYFLIEISDRNLVTFDLK